MKMILCGTILFLFMLTCDVVEAWSRNFASRNIHGWKLGSHRVVDSSDQHHYTSTQGNESTSCWWWVATSG